MACRVGKWDGKRKKRKCAAIFMVFEYKRRKGAQEKHM
jgi:hypothetical protein